MTRAVEQILDLARWAPSGDNTQPWRFEVPGDDHIVVHGFDTRSHCVYDLDGRPSQISIGALLENIAIAATAHRLRADVARRSESPEERPLFDVRLIPDAAVAPDPLVPAIPTRAVQRRAMSTGALSPGQKTTLEAAIAPEYSVVWLEGFAKRLQAASLMFRNARLRLIMPEAYLVHRDIIEWGTRHSETRIPDAALGLDPMTLRLMRWVMQSWERVSFFNRYLAGTIIPRIQLDFIPGVACAGHLAIVARRAPQAIDDFVAAGRAVQRLWLTLTGLGLHLQPEMTPLIFARYVRAGLRFSRVDEVWAGAERVTEDLSRLLGSDRAERAVFLARVGAGSAPSARSLRRPLGELMVK
jgi:hypothetical protein